MATETTNYKFQKPAENEFYDVDVQNQNWDTADEKLKKLDDEKVDASGGDIAATKVGSITASTASYPVPAANDTVKVGVGKVIKFFGDIRNWMTGVCLIGQIVNNCVTNNAKLPLSAAQGKALMDLFTKLNSDKAPTSHASTATTYGRGNASSYGHVKVSDNYSSSAGAASAGVAASSKAVYDGWSNLDSKKIDKLHITSSTLFANFRFESTAGMIAGLYLCGNVSAGKQTAVLFMIALNKSATALTTDGVRFVDLLNNQSQLISSVLFMYEPSLSTYRIKFNLKGGGGATDIVVLSGGVSNMSFYESQS